MEIFQKQNIVIPIHQVREQFPILQQKVYGKPLVYLDNGATTQKPLQVIDAISDYYKTTNSNVHRGVHYLSQQATDQMEDARQKIAHFIGAANNESIIFTKGTTDGINLVANAYAESFMQQGDEIIITEMEHHSNIVPWQLVAQRHQLTLKYIPLTDEGTLDLSQLPKLLSTRTKIIALTWVSNTLGTVNDVEAVIDVAHKHNVHVLIDAAQAVQHMPVDVQKLNADFLVASGHKMYAETGIGFLYGKPELLAQMQPYQGGGSMIGTVTMDTVTFADLPFRFEAGTPHISGAISMGAAVQFINQLGIQNIAEYEKDLMLYAETQLAQVAGVVLVGKPAQRAGALSMVFEGMHPFDVGELLDKQGVAVRTGHHCCQPIMDRYQYQGTLRASIAVYNTKEEIDIFVTALEKAIRMLQ